MVSLTNLGLGICKTQDDWVVMVPNVIPGELVRLRIYRNYKSYSDADLVEILEQSQHRIEPICSLAQTCGGCQYQHVSCSIHLYRGCGSSEDAAALWSNQLYIC